MATGMITAPGKASATYRIPCACYNGIGLATRTSFSSPTGQQLQVGAAMGQQPSQQPRSARPRCKTSLVEHRCRNKCRDKCSNQLCIRESNITNERLHECGAKAIGFHNQRTGENPMWTTCLAFGKKVNQSINQSINHFWGIIFFTCQQVYIDWLHTADIGVSQLFLGNLVVVMLETMGGQNQKRRFLQ